MNYAPLDRELAKYNVYPSTFAGISAGYKEKFSAKTWTSELAKEVSGKSDKKDLEYKKALRNIQRYEKYEKGDRGKGAHNPSRAKAPIQQALANAAKKLDPLYKNAPAGGITITIDFYDPSVGSRGRQKERSTPALHLDHQTAQQYINQARPDYTFLFDLWGDKKIGTNLWGEDGPYPADVTDVIAA